MLQTGQIPGGQDEHLRNGTIPRTAGNHALVIVTSPRALVLVMSPSALVAPCGARAPLPSFSRPCPFTSDLLLFFTFPIFLFSFALPIFFFRPSCPFSTRVVQLRFLARGRRRRLNLGLVCYGLSMEYGIPLYFCPVVSCSSFFPHLISAVTDWMSAIAILPQMVWPCCEFKMHV